MDGLGNQPRRVNGKPCDLHRACMLREEAILDVPVEAFFWAEIMGR